MNQLTYNASLAIGIALITAGAAVLWGVGMALLACGGIVLAATAFSVLAVR